MKTKNVKDTVPSTVHFPISIGDTVFCIVEDDEHHIDIVPYIVEGVALVGDKIYAVHKGTLNEVDTKDCLLPQDIRKAV